MREVIFHAGLHKTGTSSIQSFLNRTRRALRDRFGIDFYKGRYRPGNHVELHAAAMRPDRETGFKRAHPEITFGEAFREGVTQEVQSYIAASACDRVLFSAEGLSLLRYPEEMEHLRKMALGSSIRVIIYLRERSAWLASYQRQLRDNPRGLPQNIARDSYAYTAPDTWLLDYDERIGAFRAAFGRDKVTVLDYDAEMARVDNVIPSFLEAVGIDRNFRSDVWESLFLNASPDDGAAAE